MSQLSAHIRRGPEWWKFFKDEDTKNKWREHALNRNIIVQTPSGTAEIKLSRKQVRSNLFYDFYLVC